MDRKSILVLLGSFAALMLWFQLADRLFPRQSAVASAYGTNSAVANNPLATTSPPVAFESPPTITAVPSFSHVQPELLKVTNNTAIYTFTSRGGGLLLVELLGYGASVDCSVHGYPAGAEAYATLNTRAAVGALSVLGSDAIEGDGAFAISRHGQGVRAEKQLASGLTIVKDFDFGTNYLLTARVRFENRSGKSLSLPAHELVVGTASVLNYRDNPMLMGVQWYTGAKSESVNQSYFDNRTLGCLPGTPRAEYRAGESNVVWVAINNQFFTVVAIPREPAPQIIAHRVNLYRAAAEVPPQGPATPKAVGLQTGLYYPDADLKPGQVIEREYTIYAGPKGYNSLARLGSEMKNSLDLVMDFGFFGFASKALLLSMNGLNSIGMSYGLAIICITVIIKLLFWPLTHASTRSMKRMQALQPQMKALQEKYKDDPAKMNHKLMEFMRENKVSPLGGCLPMFLQIPVFMGFYRMLQSAIELRGAGFLWACDLSQPDTVAHIPFLHDFPINPLPLFMGATQLWQARLTPPSPGVDPAQQKMMRYMPLMMLFFFYKASAGLTLYWAVQNLLTIVQMKVTKAYDPGESHVVRGVAPTRKKK